jgi:large subunit ribosomal protein L21
MRGRHGKQLSLVELDATGKDDPFYDPFTELELGNVPLEDDMEEVLGDSDQSQAAEFSKAQEEEVDDDADDDEVEEIDVIEENIIEGDDGEDTIFYRNDGSVPFSKAQIARFQAGAPAGGLFAVVSMSGTQHKVTVDDVIVTSLMKPLQHFSIGSTHTLTDVLLVGSTHQTLVGMPIVAGAEVDVMIEEITRDAKVIVFKKRRRKNSQRKNGFRRDVAMLRVLDIRLPKGFQNHKHIQRVLPQVKSKLSRS